MHILPINNCGKITKKDRNKKKEKSLISSIWAFLRRQFDFQPRATSGLPFRIRCYLIPSLKHLNDILIQVYNPEYYKYV